MRLELGEVVNGAFAVCSTDDVGRVFVHFMRDLGPGCLNSSDRVGQCTVLRGQWSVVHLNENLSRRLTISKRTASTKNDEAGMVVCGQLRYDPVVYMSSLQWVVEGTSRRG